MNHSTEGIYGGLDQDSGKTQQAGTRGARGRSGITSGNFISHLVNEDLIETELVIAEQH